MAPKRKSTVKGRRDKNPEMPLKPINIPAPPKEIVLKRGQKNKKPATDVIFKRATKFHLMKRQILAPFIAELILKRRFEEFCEGLDDEMTVVELPRMSESGNNLTLGKITAESVDSSDSNDDYQEDWRKENQ